METTTRKKIFAVMLFNTEFELGISGNPNKWVNTQVTKFTDGAKALWHYANTPNPASQIVDAFTDEELNIEINKMISNYQNKEWLDENLYPYL